MPMAAAGGSGAEQVSRRVAIVVVAAALTALQLCLPAAAAGGPPPPDKASPDAAPQAGPAASEGARAGSAEQSPDKLGLGAEESPSKLGADGIRYKLGVEAKFNLRVSPDARFAVPFQFRPDELPVGQTRGFEETVNPGTHFEVSILTLLADAAWDGFAKAHAKIDLINLYYRNPTSTGRKVEVTELWLRAGREGAPARLAEAGDLYLKAGKFAKFERQNDRHLESYGLVSTAFNRFEDLGVEAGAGAGRHLFAKLSWTAGNPVFLRDPNALAGDNGTPALLRPHPNPNLNTGIDILYDTHVEDVNLDHPQLGAAVGARLADDGDRRGVEVLAWGRRRKLAPAVDLDGTFYRGDLRVILGPPGFKILPVTNDRKREAGGNLWLYWDDLSLFAQFVDQRLAGLPRRGYEAEAAWRIELPLWFAAGGRQLLTAIQPAVRFSRLANGFRNLLPTPAPSFAWNWNKLDAGVRIGLISGIDLTAEYADNTFTLGSGAKKHEYEFLSTLRLRL
jgi:hypothetical protein